MGTESMVKIPVSGSSPTGAGSKCHLFPVFVAMGRRTGQISRISGVAVRMESEARMKRACCSLMEVTAAFSLAFWRHSMYCSHQVVKRASVMARRGLVRGAFVPRFLLAGGGAGACGSTVTYDSRRRYRRPCGMISATFWETYARGSLMLRVVRWGAAGSMGASPRYWASVRGAFAPSEGAFEGAFAPSEGAFEGAFAPSGGVFWGAFAPWRV